MTQLIFSFMREFLPSLAPSVALAIIASLETIITGKNPSTPTALPAVETEEEPKPTKKSFPMGKVLMGGAAVVVIPSVILVVFGFWGRGFFIPNQPTVTVDGKVVSAPAGSTIEVNGVKIVTPK